LVNMTRLQLAKVQVEHSCGCVFDVGQHVWSGRLCDSHWWNWVLEQVGTAKQWERLKNRSNNLTKWWVR
jgi:hypothetical protein